MERKQPEIKFEIDRKEQENRLRMEKVDLKRIDSAKKIVLK